MPGSLDRTPEDELERSRSREDRYGLGQFFTPPRIADFMATAISETNPETVLDPGVGGGVLLRALASGPKLYGLDIDSKAVELASAALGQGHEIATGDFLDAANWPLSLDSFDAILANPPYLRHHNLSAAHKSLAARYTARFGHKVSTLSGSYVYFFFEALLRLNPGGRLVFITPAEFLDVRYGSALKATLLDRCELEEIVVLEMGDLAFEGVLTTSAITVATRREKPSRTFRLVEAEMNGGVNRRRNAELTSSSAPASVAWTPLLPSRAERIKPLLEGRTARLDDYARVRRGIASGGNAFFCLNRSLIDEWQIEDTYLVPVVLGSRDLPELGTLDRAHWEQRAAIGARAFLLHCHEPKEALEGTAVLRYIEHGEQLGLQQKFNCRNRTPWYGVERVPPADFFVTYMSRDKARFVKNDAGARCMTSLLNIWAKDGIDPDDLRPILEDPVNAILLREFGRTYGGGLGKIEPRDLLGLPVKPLAAATGQTRLFAG